MEHQESMSRPAPRPSRNSQPETPEQVGGEPLVGSGFEAEQPDASPDERNDNNVK